MKKLFVALSMLLVLTGCSSNKTKDATSTNQSSKENVEMTANFGNNDAAEQKSEEANSNYTASQKGEFPYYGDAKTVPFKIYMQNWDTKIDYEINVNLNPDMYLIDMVEAGKIELADYIVQYGDNINGISFERKGDEKQNFTNKFIIKSVDDLPDFNLFDFSHENSKESKYGTTSEVYTTKEGRRVYSYLSQSDFEDYIYLEVVLELGDYGVLSLIYYKNIDPAKQEEVTVDMANAIEVVSPKK